MELKASLPLVPFRETVVVPGQVIIGIGVLVCAAGLEQVDYADLSLQWCVYLDCLFEVVGSGVGLVGQAA